MIEKEQGLTMYVLNVLQSLCALLDSIFRCRTKVAAVLYTRVLRHATRPEGTALCWVPVWIRTWTGKKLFGSPSGIQCAANAQGKPERCELPERPASLSRRLDAP